MKKILCIAAFILSTVPAFSQLYLRGNVGYSLPINSQVIGTNYKETYDGGTGETEGSEEVVYGSYGSGLSFNFGFGATLNGSLGYDLELGYLMGKKYSFGDRYSDDVYTETDETEVKSSSFQITPSLTFTAGTGKVQPYTRMGPVIAITKLKYENNEHDTYNNSRTVLEYEYTGGISIGFKGVIGANFNTDKKVQFFGEISFISMSYAPKDGELTGYTVDGEDALDSIPKEDRKVEFKDKVDFDDDGNVALREKYSMGSIGIQVGIKYVLK